jgi:outer membrane protein OmpA-like peptidoglycan-associated protein/opacity protein-like surface antigen
MVRKVVFVLIFLSITILQADIYDQQIYLRFGGNGALRTGGDEDYSNIGPLGQISLLYFFSQKWGLEISAGYGINGIRDLTKSNWLTGRLSSDDNLRYQTLIIPFSINLRYNLVRNKNVIPYLTGGLGYNYWQIENMDNGSKGDKNRNFMSVVGGGIEFDLARWLALDLSFRYFNYFDQNLDMSGVPQANLPADISEGTYNVGIGLSFRFGGWVDSDGDGIPDHKDKCPSLPEDFDGFEDDDGCPDLDNDGDGLLDSVETNTGRYVSRQDTGTDPNNIDSDNDGLTDYDEVYLYLTDPCNTDTDGDNISDYDEIHLYGTDPLLADSDRDLLDDYEEIFIYFTNPIDPDTDGDGFVDGRDKCPLEPETYNGYKDDDGCPDEKPDTIFNQKTPVILEGVQFASGSSKLSDLAKLKIQKVLISLKDNPEMHLEISGHTDNTGSRSANIKLSKARAEAVRSYLISMGIDAYRLRAIGVGPDRPIASNKTKEGRAKNRRIEFYRIK